LSRAPCLRQLLLELCKVAGMTHATDDCIPAYGHTRALAPADQHREELDLRRAEWSIESVVILDHRHSYVLSHAD